MYVAFRMSIAALFGLMLTCWVTPAARAAVDEADLLPVDQAFVLTAEAVAPDRIEVRWKIADGYYLYRHRTAVQAGSGFSAGPLELPAGTRHVDEFFGPVETYRGQLVASLPGQASGAGTTLTVKYQGCADAGICYPPQTRQLQVALPRSGGGLSALTGAPGGGGLSGLLGGAGQALPESRAFSVDAIADGGDRILVRIQPAAGYYVYRDRSDFNLEQAPGISLMPPRWPAGKRHRDEHFGEVTVYFEPAEVLLPLRRSHADPVEASLVVSFQGCQDNGICYPPMTRRIPVALPAGTVTAATLAATRPGASDPGTAVAAGDDRSASVTEAGPGMAANGTLAPVAGTMTDDVASAGDAGTATAPDASAGNALRSTPPPAEGATGTGLAGALLLALLGGLVLNLMPCVLPILSLKALGLAQSGESRQRARGHALWYTAGVLVAFAAVGALVIGLRAAGQAAGWGFQLQQPWFVAALACIMFVVGLSLSGVFTLGTGLGGGLATPRRGPLGDFLTGVLACVVASPCIAPFMGPALAYAFAAPAAAGMLVFLALGFGLALPFLLIGFIPGLARRLPRPGAWMETLKQVLAFPMYLTAIWLLWILGRQRGVDAVAMMLAGAALLALALWWLERSRWQGRRVSTALALGLVVLALLPVWGVTRLEAPAIRPFDAGAIPYSEQALDQLREEDRVVFVNMTADWCVTCKANERNVLGSEAFSALLARTGARYMKGDWTNADPAISAFLEQHQAVGVPLYVVYGPGAPPAVLPPVLTQAVVEDALLRAAAR